MFRQCVVHWKVYLKSHIFGVLLLTRAMIQVKVVCEIVVISHNLHIKISTSRAASHMIIANQIPSASK